jgi:hypothetical protein
MSPLICSSSLACHFAFTPSSFPLPAALSDCMSVVFAPLSCLSTCFCSAFFVAYSSDMITPLPFSIVPISFMSRLLLLHFRAFAFTPLPSLLAAFSDMMTPYLTLSPSFQFHARRVCLCSSSVLISLLLSSTSFVACCPFRYNDSLPNPFSIVPISCTSRLSLLLFSAYLTFAVLHFLRCLLPFQI